jgi:hypothetical protein
MQIHVARDGKQLGVFSLEEVNRQLAAGVLSLSDHAWYEGAAGWAAVSTIPGVSATASSGLTPAQMAPGSAFTAPGQPTEPLAILSLVLSICGVLGLCCKLFVVLPIAGIICGHLALSKFKTAPHLQGRGLALAGVIIGYSFFGVLVITVIFLGGLAALFGLSEAFKK